MSEIGRECMSEVHEREGEWACVWRECMREGEIRPKSMGERPQSRYGLSPEIKGSICPCNAYKESTKGGNMAKCCNSNRFQTSLTSSPGGGGGRVKETSFSRRLASAKTSSGRASGA